METGLEIQAFLKSPALSLKALLRTTQIVMMLVARLIPGQLRCVTGLIITVVVRLMRV